MIRAAALVIGNEILGGKIRDTNTFALAQVLREKGVVLERVVVVPDTLEAIASEITALSASFDHVFTSGGIGPTHDDVTMAAIANAFAVRVTTDPRLEDLLRQHYGEAVTPNHLLLARVPEGSRALTIARSPWPLTVCGNVWILPGVPEIFVMKLDIIREHLVGGLPFVSRAAYTKLDEAALKPILDAIVEEFGVVDVGSYPRFQDPRYETKVTFDGTDPASVDSALDMFCRRLPEGEPLWTE